MSNVDKDEEVKKALIKLVKIMTLVFLAIAFFVTIVQLMGTKVPLSKYPVVFVKAITHPLFLGFYFCVVVLPVSWALWHQKRNRSNEKEP